MYRDDDAARAERANSLIGEIAELERQRVNHAATDRRLEAAKLELAAMQLRQPAPPSRPGAFAHLLVFAATAGAAYLGYALLV